LLAHIPTYCKIGFRGREAETTGVRATVKAGLTSPQSWRTLQGGIILLLLFLASRVAVFRQWPWLWVVPLAAFFLCASLVPSLRKSLGWLRAGRIDRNPVTATAAIIVLSSSALVFYQLTFRPDLTALGALMPLDLLGGVMFAGIFFPLLNATLEELVFRGVLFDAVEAEWGWPVALVVTAIIFGVAHVSGYPPGPVGAVLAGLYGSVLGLLRVWVGGLALPIVAHVAADATIFGILVHADALPR
jgi:membrane protease YdiL (CAAX protease family)